LASGWLLIAARKISLIPQFDPVTELAEFGWSAGGKTYCVVILAFEFTCWVKVHSGYFLRHFSVCSVITSVHSVSNCCFGIRCLLRLWPSCDQQAPEA